MIAAADLKRSCGTARLTRCWRLRGYAAVVQHEPIDLPVAQTTATPSARWWGELLALWASAAAWMVWRQWPAIVMGALPDTDDNMRMLQVRDWLAGQGWFDTRQSRLDWPVGADIHWSRLVDLPLAAIIRPLAPFIGQPAAELAAAVIVPLITLLAAMAAAALIARRTIAPSAWGWAPLILLFAGPVTGMLSPLRIDHHGWQIVALLAMAGGLVAPERRAGGAVAGLAIAASLAIGVEMLPFLLLGLALAAFGWIAEPAERARLRMLAVTLAIGIGAALLLFIPPAAHFGFGCDTLSVAWALPILIGCAGIGVATIRPVATPGRRVAVLGLIGVAAALPLAGPAGGCLIDPYHAVDPEARRLWLEMVVEALPLYRQSTETLVAALVLPLIGVVGALAMLRIRGWDRGWLILLALAIAAIGLMLLQTRAAVAAQALAVPGAAALGWLAHRRIAASQSSLIRVFGTVLLALTVTALIPRMVVALAVGDPPDTTSEARAKSATTACLDSTALAALDAVPAGTMLATIDATPALIVHSHHRGIAGPYHRNGRAIADVMAAWSGDDTAARTILKRHQATLVAICGTPTEAEIYARRNPQGLHARLSAGHVPHWLAPVAAGGTPWRVWRIIG